MPPAVPASPSPSSSGYLGYTWAVHMSCTESPEPPRAVWPCSHSRSRAAPLRELKEPGWVMQTHEARLGLSSRQELEGGRDRAFRGQALSHSGFSLPFQRNVAFWEPSLTSLALCCCLPQVMGSFWVPGPASEPGWGSEEEGKLLRPGNHRASARGLGSMARGSAHCLLKGREGVRANFYRGRTWGWGLKSF